MKWEYKSIPSDYMEYLQELGAEGWELVCSATYLNDLDGKERVLILKRPIAEQPGGAA